MREQQTTGAGSKRGRADIHMHSTYSDGLATPEHIVRFAERSDLDLIAITDHDTLAGALAAREMVAKGHFNFEVIVGTEVTTARGVHLLALFIEEPIPVFRSLEHTIDLVARQGGICIAPHPLSPLTPSVGRRQIERLLAARYPLVGVETMNPTPAGRITRAKLRRLNARWGLAEVGGSDAHFLCRIGTAYTEFEGTGAADFRASLADGTTVACEVPLPHPHVRMGEYVRQSGKSLLINPAQKIQRRLSRGA
ncbi:MAG TPA: PHP-associated domain-containing protein [Chloroflexota bacterium]|nr:PHP-associated domain-containing protein [Chloroflexota bacterium]